jgi:hypothetical protein
VGENCRSVLPAESPTSVRGRRSRSVIRTESGDKNGAGKADVIERLGGTTQSGAPAARVSLLLRAGQNPVGACVLDIAAAHTFAASVHSDAGGTSQLEAGGSPFPSAAN